MIDIFPGNKLLSAEEVAPALGVKPSTVKDWAYKCKIPCIRLTLGKRGVIKFSGKRLNQWLEEKSQEPGEGSNQEKTKIEMKRVSQKKAMEFNRAVDKI